MGNGNRSNAGFSVIEVLIAAGIFLIIAVGLLPLFVESIRNNLRGREATDVSNMGKSRLEEYFQLPFDSTRLEVSDGRTEMWVSDFYKLSTAGPSTWAGAVSGGSIFPWTRTTRIRQFNINNLSQPLDGAADPGQVHLKEVRVELESRRTPGNPFGSRRELVLQVYKAK